MDNSSNDVEILNSKELEETAITDDVTNEQNSDLDDEAVSTCSDEHPNEFDILEAKLKNRQTNPSFPSTVTTLDFFYPLEDDGSGTRKLFGKVYLVGTAHFSHESQNDVKETIQATQPDAVMLELCPDRLAILAMDEEKLLEQAKQLNMRGVMQIVKETGIIHGLLHCMLLSISANITKQLGMAPGGEFRTAFKELKNIPCCTMRLGDRPIDITLKRAFGSLSAWQKLKLFGGLLISHACKITKEDVEKTKNRDLLEELLKEMAGEFPHMSRIFVDERDQYMAHVLRTTMMEKFSQRCMLISSRGGQITDLENYPVIVVGVVGLGHAPGITSYWTEWTYAYDASHLLTVPPPSKWPRLVSYAVRGALFSVAAYFLYRTGLFISRLFQ